MDNSQAASPIDTTFRTSKPKMFVFQTDLQLSSRLHIDLRQSQHSSISNLIPYYLFHQYHASFGKAEEKVLRTYGIYELQTFTIDILYSIYPFACNIEKVFRTYCQHTRTQLISSYSLLREGISYFARTYNLLSCGTSLLKPISYVYSQPGTVSLFT